MTSIFMSWTTGKRQLCERRYEVLWIQYELLFSSLMTVFTVSLGYTDTGLIWVTWATQTELKWVWIFLKCFLGKVECEEVFKGRTRFANVERLKSSIERDLILSFVISTFQFYIFPCSFVYTFGHWVELFWLTFAHIHIYLLSLFSNHAWYWGSNSPLGTH